MSVPQTFLNPESGDSVSGDSIAPRASMTPYAVPASAGANVSADGARPGPYVPAAWRGRYEETSAVPAVGMRASAPTPAFLAAIPAQDAPELPAPLSGTADDSLPWIDTFLATTPAEPLRAVPEHPEGERAVNAEDATAEATEEAAAVEVVDVQAGDVEVETVEAVETVETVEAQASEAAVDQVSSDELSSDDASIDALLIEDALDTDPGALPSAALPDDWPLEEAASELDALSQQFGALDAESLSHSSPSETSPPLPVWSDDDMVDIMPLQRPLFTPRGQPAFPAADMAGAQAAARADSAEAAAHALELLARRVRAGELPLAGYEPRMGDAAALVAALAALLGVKLG